MPAGPMIPVAPKPSSSFSSSARPAGAGSNLGSATPYVTPGSPNYPQYGAGVDPRTGRQIPNSEMPPPNIQAQTAASVAGNPTVPNYDLQVIAANLIGGQLAGSNNSQLQQQLALLNAANTGGGGGGGNSALAGIANQIAGLQNNMHDVDINNLIAQLHQLPQLTALNKNSYTNALGTITANQNAAKQQQRQGTMQLTSDTMAKGAMTSSGYAAGKTALSDQLQQALAQLHGQTAAASGQYRQNILDMQKSYGDTTSQIAKLRTQKQIEDLQAKSAGLGGGGGDGGLGAFMKAMQSSQLQGQMQDPQQIASSLLMNPMYANNPQAMLQLLQSLGISIPNFAQGPTEGAGNRTYK